MYHIRYYTIFGSNNNINRNLTSGYKKGKNVMKKLRI